MNISEIIRPAVTLPARWMPGILASRVEPLSVGRPETGGIVARLPSNQRVAVRGRQGQWVRVEFERKGKHVLGWTLETNLQLR